MIKPTLEEVKRMSKGYNKIPISFSMLSDVITPINLMKILKGVSKHCYMLESVERQETWGRYTFLGYDPVLGISCMNETVMIKDLDKKREKIIRDRHPNACIKAILKEYASPKVPGLPTFTGGLVGYFGYDYIKYKEPKLKLDGKDEEGFKDMDLMLFDKVIAFDNLKQKIIIIVNADVKDLEKGYEKGVSEIYKIRNLIMNGKPASIPKGKILSEIKPLFNKEEYKEMVEKAKSYIYEGDIFQVVLSNRLEAKMEGSLFHAYRVLRTINPSPYMFYFSGDDIEVIGASPETLVKLEDGILHTFPLAGTRPRGKSKEEDKALEQELILDKKECAEHNMLVDLGRNDLGKISKFGTVSVENYMSVERFSHVMHIGSTVRGEIENKYSSVEAIEAVLPAGTLSGAPKLRACEIINELEDCKRGIYGGAIGYIDFSGNMDTCIAIRIAYKKNGKVFARSGAGIVADSVPEKEYEECINKAKAIIKALYMQEEVE